MENTLVNLLKNYWTTNPNIIRADRLKLIEKEFINEIVAGYSLDTSVIRASNFTNIFFDDVDFSGSYVYDTEFNNCLFDRTVFSKAIFKNCVFINCKFINSRLKKFELEKTVFQGYQFENVLLSGNYIENCTFEDSNFN